VLDEDGGGVYPPRCDRKCPEPIEKKRVAGAPLRQRVRKRLKAKGLNSAVGRENETKERLVDRVGAGAWQTRERIAWEHQLVKCYAGNGENRGVDGNGAGLTVREAARRTRKK
jgi:hypothetical protein